MIRITLATLGVATVALAPAALGSEPLTKPEVIKRGSAICMAGEQKVNALPQIRSENPFSKTAPAGDRQRAIVFLAGYADALAGVRRGLAQLNPPAEDRTLFVGFVADLGPIVATFRKAHREAVAGRYHAALTDTDTAFGLFARASKKTKAYGFPKGVCQAGSS
jgi:hypothetical protein